MSSEIIAVNCVEKEEVQEKKEKQIQRAGREPHFI